MISCRGCSSRSSTLPLLKTILFLFILLSLFIGTASAAQTTVTTATYGENLFDYSNGVLTNHDGITYERGAGGTVIINDERFLAFAIRGDRGSGLETVTSMDFSWDWTVEQVGQDYILHATNGNSNFLWEQTWYFYHDFGTPMKIEHYLENNLGVPINNAHMFYIITVDANDSLEYNRIIYPVSDYTTEPLHKTGDFNNLLASADFNDIFGFNFGDLINTGFNITEIYIGNFDFSGYPNQNVLAVGFTKGNSVFQNGSSVTIDPQIIAEPDTYAVYGQYDADFLDDQLYSTGWDGNDIDYYTEMTSTQYAALSTDDTTYAVTGSDAQADGYLYVNFSVPYVDSINWFHIEVIAIGNDADGWFMGAYDDVADGWITMNSTTTAGDVSLTYNVTGAEVATYSELTGTDATFGVSIWTSVKGASITDVDLISVTFNYEYEDLVKPTYSGVSVNASGNGKPCEFSIIYDDNIALENDGQYIFATNNTGVWVNESAVNFTSTPETITTDKILNSTIGTVVGYRWYADDSAGNVNDTPIYTLTIIDDFWDANSTLINGLGNVVEESGATVFYNLFGDDKWHTVIGKSNGDFDGYQWTGSAWTSNATVINGLTGIAQDARPDVFYNFFGYSKWYLISGAQDGTFKGWDWNGTGWESNATIVTGLGDISSNSDPTVFYDFFDEGEWYLLSGEYMGNDYHGYQWNGTSWVANNTIENGLTEIGTVATPKVVYNLFSDNKWHLMIGCSAGVLFGYQWNGTEWERNTTLESGFVDIGSRSRPEVFFNLLDDEKWSLLTGSSDGNFYGFHSDFEGPPDVINPTYSNVAHNTTLAGESCTFSITYDDDTALHPNGQYIFATNNTGVWVNESAVNFTSTPETIETIKTLNSTGNTPIGYRWYADDNGGNINNTPIYTLTTVKLPGVKISGDDDASTAATAYTTSRETIRTSDGTLWVFYEGGDDAIYGVNSTDNGSTWNTPELVNDVIANDQYFVTAAIDSNDVIHVMWYGTGWGDNPSAANIQYKNRTASGWGTQENVTNKDVTQFGPSVAVDSNDVVHLIWYGLGWGSNTSDYDLQYMNRTSSGWGTQENVTDMAEIQRFPNIAIDSNDNIHVVWYGTGLGDNPTHRNAAYRNRTVNGWGDRKIFADDGNEHYLPVITIDNDDVIHAAWRVLNGSDTSIYYRNKTSSSWGTPEEVHTSTNGDSYPTISADNSNNIHIVWDRLSDGTLWYVNKTNDWGDIEYLGHAGNVTTSHPSTMWSMWPQIDGIRTGVPETGIGYAHTNSYADVHVRYDSRYLTWQTAVTYNTTYANVSETVTFTDTVTLTKIAAPLEIDESDTITISDGVTLIKTLASVLYNIYVEETITIADSVSITKIVAPIIYEVYEDEIITITDSIDVNKILASVMYYANVSDTVTFTDGLVVIKTVASVLYTTKVDDTITITDSVGITKTSAPILNKINISDTVGIADSVSIEKTTASILYTSNVSDTITITDGVALTKTLAAINYTSNVSDTITITDGVALTKTTAGINYTTNVSDTITIADGVVVAKTLASINYSINVSETIVFTDSATLIKITAPVNYIANVSEIITFTDDAALIKTTAGIIYTVNISDTIAIVDSVSLTKTLAAINYSTNVSDTITFTDSASLIKTTAGINYTSNVSDTISITDSVALTKTLAAINYTSNVSEIITVTDSVIMNKTTAGINYSIDEPETITITDSISVSKTLAAINYTTNVSDTITFVDGVSLEKTTAAINYSINISDSITLADSVVMNKTLASVGYNISTPDTISVTDDVEITKTTAGINYSTNISDTVTLSDSVSLTKTLAAINYTTNVSETITFTDSAVLTKTVASINYTTNVSETITFTDTVSMNKTLASVGYNVSIEDTVSFTDSVSMNKTTAGINYSIDVSDTIVFTDSVSMNKTLAAINYSTNISDTISVSDGVSITKVTASINYSVNVSDTIVFTDSISVSKTLAAINYTTNVSDTITYTDSVALTKSTAGVNYITNVSDTITYSDDIIITKTLAAINYTSNISDTIAYTDSVVMNKTTASINYTANVSDTISITDSVVMYKTLASINYSVNTSDIITYSDDVSIEKITAFINYTSNVSETITLTDSVSLTKTLAAINYSTNVSDTITITDSVVMDKTTAFINYTVNMSDTITLTDSVSIEKTLAAINYSVNTSDTITFIDSVSLSKTMAVAINYTVNISDTIAIVDSVSLTKTSAANNEVFSFTNATIVPSTLTRDEPFIVLVDINDTDGTIVEAVVKISSINYTMSNVGGDTWSYIFAEPNFARRYYVTDFYAKDDLGAWNGTTSTLSIGAIPTKRGGRGVTTPTPTPLPTPEIIPIIYPEEPVIFIEVTDYLLNFLGDFVFAEDVFIFKIIFDPNEYIITKTFYRDDTFSCIHSPSVINNCIMDDSNIAVSVEVDVDKSFIHDEVLNDIVYDENSELYVDVKVFIINLMVGLHLMDTDINNPSLYFFTDNAEGKINGIRVLPMLLFATIGGLILYTGRNVRNIKMTDITYSYYYLDNYLTTKAKTIKNKDTWRTWYNTWHDDLVTKAKETRKTLKFKYNYYRRYVRNYIWAFRIRKGL